MMRFDLAELRELITLTAAAPQLQAQLNREYAFLTRFNVGDRIWTGNVGWGRIVSADDTSWRVRLEVPYNDGRSGEGIEFLTISRREGRV